VLEQKSDENQLSDQINSVEADLDQQFIKESKSKAKRKKALASFLQKNAVLKAPTFYEGCGFTGKAKVQAKLGDVMNVADVGMSNDAISSIKVPTGYCVTLFEATSKKGAYLDIRGPTNLSCLKNKKMIQPNPEDEKNWDNEVSSFSIRKCVALTAKQLQLRAAAKKAKAKAAASKAVMVSTKAAKPHVTIPTFYKHCQYKGKSVGRKKGTPFIVKSGMANDAISSLIVPRGYCVTLYEHVSMKGKFLKIHGPKHVSCLTKIKMNGKTTWNDAASSMHIKKCKSLTQSQITKRATTVAKKAIKAAAKAGAGLSTGAAVAYSKVDNKINRIVKGAVKSAAITSGNALFKKKAFKKTNFAKKSQISKTDKKLGVDAWKHGMTKKDKAKIKHLNKIAMTKVKLLKEATKDEIHNRRKVKAFERQDDHEDQIKQKKNSKGCDRTDGCTKDLAPHKRTVTVDDAHTGISGNYYLGRRRRRIGTGFGRRRAPYGGKKGNGGKIPKTPVASIEKMDSKSSYSGYVTATHTTKLSSKKGFVDKWTKRPTGNKCYWDKTKKRRDCAVCRKGGCQCPKKHKHQCVKCGRDISQCGLAKHKAVFDGLEAGLDMDNKHGVPMPKLDITTGEVGDAVQFAKDADAVDYEDVVFG